MRGISICWFIGAGAEKAGKGEGYQEEGEEDVSQETRRHANQI